MPWVGSVIFMPRHWEASSKLVDFLLETVALGVDLWIRPNQLMEVFEFFTPGLRILGNFDSFINQIHYLKKKKNEVNDNFARRPKFTHCSSGRHFPMTPAQNQCRRPERASLENDARSN